MAHRIQAQRITWCGSSDQPLSRHLTVALAESIVDGNEIYEALANDGLLHDVNLTLPEAMSACSHRFHRLIEWVRFLDRCQIYHMHILCVPNVIKWCPFIDK